jgi:hypothetical protein
MTGLRGVLTLMSRSFWTNRLLHILRLNLSGFGSAKRLGIDRTAVVVAVPVRAVSQRPRRATAKLMLEEGHGVHGCTGVRCGASRRVQGWPR